MTGLLLATTIVVGACTPALELEEAYVPRELEPAVDLEDALDPEEFVLDPTPDPMPDPKPLSVRDKVRSVLRELGREHEYVCLDRIFAGESSWRPDAIGDGGDSFGLGQRNAPAHGAPPWPWPIREQVKWFLEYADTRYGGACPAAERWQERADRRGGAGWW